ncbi:hypothetical protein L0659_02780 [Dyadobacter sp. CY347]|nr:hypothetical protein [Dyadobacter sp. CY347]
MEVKIEVIYDYYNTLCKNDVINDIIEFELSRKSGRTLDISPDNLTDPEKNVLLSNPGYAQHYINAANSAKVLVKNIFGSDDGEKRENAFKHAVWNALAIRYILKGSPASENQAIDFTQDGTSAHEKNNQGGQNKDKLSAMDLHNNMSARVWMEKEVKWGIGPFRKMPDESKIIETMHSRANSGLFHSNQTTILNAHGGDNANTWNNLYNNLYGAHQHLVYVKN